jgi:hypothetical protein
MPSTYTNNLGIEKIQAGEKSGTWGDITNENFDILDRDSNGITSITLASAGTSGSPNILPITDGELSNGQYKFIEYIDGGDLGGTCFAQLTPNDAQKIVYIKNNLSGSRDLTIFQGTYSPTNALTVRNGTTVLIKFDGAGTPATATNVNDGLVVNDLTVTGDLDAVNLTLTGNLDLTSSTIIGLPPLNDVDINGGTIDGTIIGADVPAAGSFTDLTVTGDLNASINSIKDIDFQSYGVPLAGFSFALGAGALSFDGPTGISNVGLGDFALGSITSSAAYNTAIGFEALRYLTTGDENTAVGFGAANGFVQALDRITGDGNTFVGSYSGAWIKSGNFNVGVGYDACSGTDVNGGITGDGNIGIGDGTLSRLTSADDNIAIGRESLFDTTIGNDNFAAGYQALTSNTSGDDNVAIGLNALSSNTSGGSNVAIGQLALSSNTTAGNNVGIGFQSLRDNTVGFDNIGIGYRTLRDNTTGDLNIAIGNDALLNNTIGNDNVALGDNALYLNDSGTDNIALGKSALGTNSSGQYNTAVGSGALINSTTGNNNNAFGNFTFGAITTGSGNIGVGHVTSTGSIAPVFSVTTENNRIVMGHTSVTNAYVQVAWTVVSDARDKMNFSEVPHGLDFVNNLNPVSYQFRVDRETEEANGGVRYGFKAQDILALEGDSPVIIDNENPDKLLYNGESLVPVLVNAIKELTEKVELLQAEVLALKNL